MKFISYALATALSISTTSPVVAESLDVTFDLDLDVELECKTIVQLAVENPDLSTLVTAITTAGLAETLSSVGPFTVFAPLDTGFDALPEGTVADLLEPENKEQLTGLLLGHVVAGIVKSDDLEDGPVPTLNGDAVEVKGAVTPVKINQAKAIAPPERKYSSFKINDANVKKADIEACNGVIHLIDAVLLPAMPKEPETSSPTDTLSSKSGKSTAKASKASAKSGESDADFTKKSTKTDTTKTTSTTVMSADEAEDEEEEKEEEEEEELSAIEAFFEIAYILLHGGGRKLSNHLRG